MKPGSGTCFSIRHRKSWASSSSVGFLNDARRTPPGFTRPSTCLIVPSLPDVSMPCRISSTRRRVAGGALREQPLLQVGQPRSPSSASAATPSALRLRTDRRRGRVETRDVERTRRDRERLGRRRVVTERPRGGVRGGLASSPCLHPRHSDRRSIGDRSPDAPHVPLPTREPSTQRRAHANPRPQSTPTNPQDLPRSGRPLVRAQLPPAAGGHRVGRGRLGDRRRRQALPRHAGRVLGAELRAPASRL